MFPSLATTASPADDSSLWSFDNNALDSLSGYNGIGINSPSYYTPGINGYGSALLLDELNSQYVSVPEYRNLAYRSFTIEMWIYPTGLTNADNGLFNHFHDWAADQLLHCTIRSYVLYFGFYRDDIYGSSVIQNNQWYHVAFVFDYFSLTKTIYLNGILDSSGDSSCYQGLNGSISIGKIDHSGGFSVYFSG